MSNVATAPQGAVGMMWIVAPRVAVIVERNGRPTVPMRVSARTTGAVQAAIVIGSVAWAPHGEVTVIVAVPAAVGVPEMTLPMRVRPAGSWSTVTVPPSEGTSVARNGTPTVPDVRSAVMVGSGQALMGMSMEAVEPQSAVTTAWIVPVTDGVPEMTLPI